MMATSGRATLTFPSPYLRNAATALTIEGGSGSDVASWHRDEVTSYESGFKAELVAFSDAVRHGTAVATSGEDAARDIAVCQSIIRFVRDRQPIDHPSDL